MHRKRIVLTGAGGQLGLTIRKLWAESPLRRRFTLDAFEHDRLDVTRPRDITTRLALPGVEMIINAAACTRVDGAETDQARALAINGEGAHNLAAWAAANDAAMVQISTDFVFDGHSSRPWRADDAPSPLNVYGASKLAGEQAVRLALPERGMVLRTSWLYSARGRNFLTTMLRLMTGNEPLRVVNDQTGAPTSTLSLTRLLFAIIDRGSRAGIFHWCDAGQTTWYGFATAIRDEALRAGLLPRKGTITPVATADYPSPAHRPAYSVLDTSQTVAAFGCKPASWRSELREVLRELHETGHTAGPGEESASATSPAVRATAQEGSSATRPSAAAAKEGTA